jgi:hypothetical protein
MTFSTSFYIAWFFAFDLLIFAPVVVYMSWFEILKSWRTHSGCITKVGLVACASFCVGIIPFVFIYTPALTRVGHRSAAEYIFWSPVQTDIVNVWELNVVWGTLARLLGPITERHLELAQLTIAFTPTVLVLTAASFLLAAKRCFWPQEFGSQSLRGVAFASAAIPFVFFLIAAKFGDFSLFKLVYDFVPGATAIRAGHRGVFVADLFATIAIALAFDRLMYVLLRRPSPMRVRPLFWVVSLLLLAMVEQLGAPYPTSLSRSFERKHLLQVGQPPTLCRSFYVADEPEFRNFEVQTDAMMVAIVRSIPTINGYSGFQPPGWGFFDTKDQNYERTAVNWAIRRQLTDGLCRLDIQHGEWANVMNNPGLACLIKRCILDATLDAAHEFNMELKIDGDGERFTGKGWSVPEPWGRWTSDFQALISFTLNQRRDYRVVVSLRALVSARVPQQTAWIDANGCRVAEATFDQRRGLGTQTVSGTISENCIKSDGTIVLGINTDRVSTPTEVGINSDKRRLGIGVEAIIISY